MPRVYRPRESGEGTPEPPVFLKRFIRMEVLCGTLLMTVGGFVARVKGDYSLIVVGVTLAGLGIYRLSKSYGRKRGWGMIDEDRVLNKLKYHFDANYSVAVDYDLPGGDLVTYLVLGPPGVLILERWGHPGTVEEIDGSWRREYQDEIDEHPNPRERNADRVEAVRSLLGEEWARRIPVESLVVVTTRKAEGEPLRADDVVHLRNLLDAVRGRTTDSSLSWEEVNELEERFGLERD